MRIAGNKFNLTLSLYVFFYFYDELQSIKGLYREADQYQTK